MTRRTAALLTVLACLAGCSAMDATGGGSAATAAASGGSSRASAAPGTPTGPTPSSGSASASSTPSPTTTRLTATSSVDCTKLKCVALTYDDGPSPLTPKLLKAFTDRNSTATLFMLGNAAQTYPQTVRQAHHDGFEIANHTYDHKAISELSDQQVAWEVRKTDDVLEKLTGQRPKLMRPPYAARTHRTDQVVGKEGLSVIVWHNSPEDWVAGHDTAKVITQLTLERTTRNSIILMHDIHPWTVDAAPAIIDGLHQQGYTLVTVSQLLGTTKPGQLYPK